MKKNLKAKKSKMKGTRTFLKKGTCSRTFFYLLNKEFGHSREEEEQAIDPLAGGLLQQGYQCGMLWGASMAIGAEANRRSKNEDEAITISLQATKYVMDSFKVRTKSIDCEEITKTNFNNKWSMAKYMVSGKFLSCFTLAGKWAPEAHKAAMEGLAITYHEKNDQAISCSSELIKKMGGSVEEAAMVSGFAGGLGLSGNACGALAASIWKNALQKIKEENLKPSFDSPELEKIVQKFYEVSNYKMECHEICSRRFSSVEEHTDFIKRGGCKSLIMILAQS
jgi:hypothetical protein